MLKFIFGDGRDMFTMERVFDSPKSLNEIA